MISCVEENPPYRTHPYNLVGKKCKQGVCILDVDETDMTVDCQGLGIQCVKKQRMPESLNIRSTIGIDPFQQGFEHMRKGSINMNAIRLCFQCYLTPSGNREHILLKPIVSSVIRDKKAFNDLTIVDYSDNWSPVSGGKKIILFTKKIF